MNNTLTFKNYLSKTFLTLTIGLATSTITAFFVSRNIYSILYAMGSRSSIALLIICIAELGVAFYFNSRIMSMSKSTAWICYIAYSVLTGFSLSTLFAVYSLGSIVLALGITCVVFICMSVIGLTTSLDFSNLTTLFSTGLIITLILNIVSSFIFSQALNTITLFISVLVFLGLIAYDIQKLRNIYSASFYDTDMSDKLMILGAFQLYLDFINLFIRVLEVFGRRDNDR